MARVKRGVTTRAKHKRILDNAKGYYGRRKNTIRIARQAVEKAGQYAYRDRKVKKRSFRALWIQRINAAVRAGGPDLRPVHPRAQARRHQSRSQGARRHRDARRRGFQRDHRPGQGRAGEEGGLGHLRHEQRRAPGAILAPFFLGAGERRTTAGINAMRSIIVFGAGLVLATSALANDTTASSGAGGLVLQRTDAVDMVSEDLFVSADRIRIRYVFRNRTPRDVDTIVAFPMPDRDLGEEYGGDVGYPSDFKTRVAGRPITARLERKAVIKGKDYTALLGQLKVPNAPDSINDATKAMDQLAPAQKARLVKLGLAGDEEYGNTGQGMKHHLMPLWTVKDSMWWRQRFPAGRDLAIEHELRPRRRRQRRKRNRLQAIPDNERQPADDQALLHRPRVPRGGRSPVPEGPDEWTGHARHVDRLHPHHRCRIGAHRSAASGWWSTRASRAIWSAFCETGVKKIGPTQYEVRHANWRPARDLHVLIIQPAR